MSDVERAQRELERLARKNYDEAKSEANLQEKIARAKSAIASTKSASTIKSKLSEIASAEKGLVQVQKKKAEIAKQTASATAALHKSQQRASADQIGKQRALVDKLQRQQNEFQSRALRIGSRPQSSTEPPKLPSPTPYDAFVSHASEDKDEVVRPLAERLTQAGFDIWVDELRLTVGDSLRRSIDNALSRSRFGIVVLSPSFFAKNWPQYELDGLVTREMEGPKVILPIWHKVSKDEVRNFSPSLAGKFALSTASFTIDELASKLAEVLRV